MIHTDETLDLAACDTTVYENGISVAAVLPISRSSPMYSIGMHCTKANRKKLVHLDYVYFRFHMGFLCKGKYMLVFDQD